VTAVAQRPSPTVEDLPAEPKSRRQWGWVFAAAVPTALTGLHASFYGQWIVDDAGITFAYARSLATGAGPVLQAGSVPVEGFSNPTWLAVLVLGRVLRLFDHGSWFGVPDVVLYPKMVALLCCFGVFALMFSIARTISRRPVALTLITGTATASVPSFVIWTTSGLENGLFALVVMAIAAVLARAAVSGRLLDSRIAVAAGILAAVAALTRPDGIIFLAAFPIATVLAVVPATVRRTVIANLISLAAFAIPACAYLTWRMFTFGDYVTNTARAKEQGLPTIGDLGRPEALVEYTGWLTAGLAVAVIAAVLSRPSPTRTAVGMLLVPLGLAVANYAVLREDWMAQHRFATAVWPLAALAVTLSAVRSLGGASTRRRLVATTLATGAAGLTVIGFWHDATAFRADPTVGICTVAQNTGYWINGYADILEVRDGTLLAVDGGGSSLTSRLHLVDLSGLADARIARFWQDDDMSGLRDYLLEDLRPTFVMYYSGWAGRGRLAIENDPRFLADYVQLWSGGQWVRRDSVPDPERLAAARQWGDDVLALIDREYTAVPYRWWCGDTLRPSKDGSGSPAPSPLTRAH
jgi:hypothetical protein